MKHILLFESIFATLCIISISQIDSSAKLCTLHLMQANTQGKRQWKRQQQAFGKNFELDYLQRTDRLAQAESQTIKSHSLLMRRLTAPILLPQPTTKYPLLLRKMAAMSTSLHYDCPKVIYYPSVLMPQPWKSKQASPTPSGSEDRKSVPQNLLDPLPCKYRTTQRIAYCVYRVNSKGIQKISILNC